MPSRRPESARASVALAALLQLGGTPALAATADADQPIHIRADRAELDERRGLAIYRGNVQMEQGSLRVTADTMTIEIADEEVVRITAEGRRAHYQQRFKDDAPVVQADAESIVYHTRDERVELRGNARLMQEPNEFSGELINYDMRAGKVDATSENGDGVRMILKPPPTTR
jgi:lipopolysaccharide export system protein LptA